MALSNCTPLNCSSVWAWLSNISCLKLHVVTWHYSIDKSTVYTIRYTPYSTMTFAILISCVKTTLCPLLLMTWKHESDSVFACDQQCGMNDQNWVKIVQSPRFHECYVSSRKKNKWKHTKCFFLVMHIRDKVLKLDFFPSNIIQQYFWPPICDCSICRCWVTQPFFNMK